METTDQLRRRIGDGLMGQHPEETDASIVLSENLAASSFRGSVLAASMRSSQEACAFASHDYPGFPPLVCHRLSVTARLRWRLHAASHCHRYRGLADWWDLDRNLTFGLGHCRSRQEQQVSKKSAARTQHFARLSASPAWASRLVAVNPRSRPGPGLHGFCIRHSGIGVFPRAIVQPEDQVLSAIKGSKGEKRVQVGCPDVRDMLGDGLPGGFTVRAAGLPGSGKTALAAAFVAEGVTVRDAARGGAG